MKKILLISLPFLLLSCAGSKSIKGLRSSAERSIADSLLAGALDNEALYSLLDTLKPMSSIRSLSFPVARDSHHTKLDYQIVADRKNLDTIALYQRICQQLSNDKVQFVLIPFQQTYKGQRNLEIYAINLKKFKSKLKEQASFFGQFGITPESDPVQVVTLIEYESKYDRWRGYGYLFGYPEYAVNFFTEAGQRQDSTGQFVKRDFFQIPVYAAPTGHFTYAMPKDHLPGAADSLLYHQAADVLQRYKKIRSQYTRSTGLKAFQLWKNFRK